MIPVPTAPLRLDEPVARKGFWQRRVIEPLGAQLTQGISVEKLAVSLTVGSLCAFFPILGLATPLCVAAAIVFRLNQAVIQLINWITVPLYPPLIFALVRIGDWILGSPPAPAQTEAMLARLARVAGHAVVGWAILAPIWIIAGYQLSRPLIAAAAVRFGAARGRKFSNGV